MDAQVVYDGEMLIKPLVMNVLLEVQDGNDACVGSCSQGEVLKFEQL